LVSLLNHGIQVHLQSHYMRDSYCVSIFNHIWPPSLSLKFNWLPSLSYHELQVPISSPNSLQHELQVYHRDCLIRNREHLNTNSNMTWQFICMIFWSPFPTMSPSSLNCSIPVEIKVHLIIPSKCIITVCLITTSTLVSFMASGCIYKLHSNIFPKCISTLPWSQPPNAFLGLSDYWLQVLTIKTIKFISQ